MKTSKVVFTLSEDTKSPYNPAFVEMIRRGHKEIAEGRGKKMSISEFKKLCKLE